LFFCIERVKKEIESLPESPFHVVTSLQFSNSRDEVAFFIDRFFQQETDRFDIRAVYAEMNGFDINPDRWYFDLFAYDSYGGHESYDRLSDWKSGDVEDIPLTGLEALQSVHLQKQSTYWTEGDEAGEEMFAGTRDYCSL
jgi:hypothetical protein